MTVGTDSYITVAEADTYVSGHYLTTSDQYRAWDALDDTQKAVILVQSCDQIERIPFSGYKTDSSQVLQFPRDGNTDVPLVVLYAQIINALSILTTPAASENPASRGVRTYTIDGFSETFFAGVGSAPTLSSNVAYAMLVSIGGLGHAIR